MNTITVYNDKTAELKELSVDEFLALYARLMGEWEFGWSVLYKGVDHPIFKDGMKGIPNNDVFKEMIRKGLW